MKCPGGSRPVAWRSMHHESRAPTLAMQSNRPYVLSIATDLATPARETGWQGTRSVGRLVDAALVEAFRRTKLEPPRPEIRVDPTLQAGQIQVATRDGLKALFHAPGPGERWILDPEDATTGANSLLFGLRGRVVEEGSQPVEFSADRNELFELLAAHLIAARGLAVADTGALASLADVALGNPMTAGTEPSSRAQALAQWARAMFTIGVPELSTIELLDAGISVAAHEAQDPKARENAVRAGVVRLAAGWARLIQHRELPMFEVSAELCQQLSARGAGQRNRAQVALRRQLALVMLRLPNALRRPGVLAIQAEAAEQAAWGLLLDPELAGLPKTSMALADFSGARHRRSCVLGVPENGRGRAA